MPFGAIQLSMWFEHSHRSHEILTRGIERNFDHCRRSPKRIAILFFSVHCFICLCDYGPIITFVFSGPAYPPARMCRDKVTGTRVREKFWNVIDLKYVYVYVRATGSHSQIKDAIYSHIPMHSPVDRATVEHMNCRYKSERCETIFYAIGFISILC